VKPLQPPGTNDPDTLTAAGVTAVKAMSEAAGHPIKGPIAKVEPSGSASSGSGSSFTSIGLAGGLGGVALAAIALIGIGIRRNRPTEVDE
jgi:hypothetical protein